MMTRISFNSLILALALASSGCPAVSSLPAEVKNTNEEQLYSSYPERNITVAAGKRELLETICEENTFCLGGEKLAELQEFATQLWQVYFNLDYSLGTPSQVESECSVSAICDPSSPPLIYFFNFPNHKSIGAQAIPSIEADGSCVKIIYVFGNFSPFFFENGTLNERRTAQLLGHEIGHFIFQTCTQVYRSYTSSLGETFADLCAIDLTRHLLGESDNSRELEEATCSMFSSDVFEQPFYGTLAYFPHLEEANNPCSPLLPNIALIKDSHGSSACRYVRMMERYNQPLPENLCVFSYEELVEECSRCVFGFSEEDRRKYCRGD